MRHWLLLFAAIAATQTTNVTAQSVRQDQAALARTASTDFYKTSATTQSTPSVLAQPISFGCASDGCDASTSCGCNDGCSGGTCCNSGGGSGLFGNFLYNNGCGLGIDWPCGGSLECLGEPKKAFDGCFTKCRGIDAGGWIAQGYTANPDGPSDRTNGPVTWMDRSNDYQLNEVYLYAGKAANADSCCWDYGWRADAMYGTNHRWATSAGLESRLNGRSDYGIALPQFYGEIARCDWTIKFGHFISPVGFYTVGTANNFFNVLPYTYQYGEPFTHTGVLATKKVSDRFTWGNGFVRGWDNFDDFNPNLSYLSTATYTRNNGDTLAWVGLFGREPTALVQNGRDFAGTFHTRYFQTLVYTHRFSDDIVSYLQSDYGIQGDAVNNTGPGRWYGLNSYLYWNQTCRCQWGMNSEWFRDEQGVRVGQVLPSPGSPGSSGFARGPFAGNFYRFTFGPKYNFTSNLFGRANFLWDSYSGRGAANGALPFDDGTKKQQQMLAFDLVYTF
ncbi:MAG: outer membrane beta-barrel protein [Planctomycetota bacterium]|nr:outer membrane beta-barrel protein [Planctomycetota bacterium]